MPAKETNCWFPPKTRTLHRFLDVHSPSRGLANLKADFSRDMAK